jgi:TolA-binding protein
VPESTLLTSDLFAGLEPDKEGIWRCPLEGCDYQAVSKQSLGMHFVKSHGAIGPKTVAARKADSLREDELEPGSMSSQVRTQLRELTAPLREQVQEIEQRLAQINREVRDLREAKRQIESVLAKLEDSPAKKPVAVSNGSEAKAAKRRQAVEAFIAAHHELLKDGFTMNWLVEQMKDQGAMALTTKTMAPVLEQLRDTGVVRADRVTRGGGMSYRVN